MGRAAWVEGTPALLGVDLWLLSEEATEPPLPLPRDLLLPARGLCCCLCWSGDHGRKPPV